MPLFKPEPPPPEEAEPVYDDPKALPTIAIWLLLAAAILFSALVAHQADPDPGAPPLDADASAAGP